MSMRGTIGYCTNVHAGTDLAETKHNLDRFATAVRQQVRPDGELPVGLWLPAPVARQLVHEELIAEFRDWLEQRRLRPYTLNGFPYGNFHQPVVKYDVYLPSWFQTERANYTLDLIKILGNLVPDRAFATISTLPIAWSATEQERLQAARSLAGIAQHLKHHEQETGQHIMVCLEPEPGCVLSTSQQTIDFITEYLDPVADQAMVRRYLGVCHDICHTAVMFGDQAEDLAAYDAEGIGIGKVQISSAVMVSWDLLDDTQRASALQQLRKFAEDRYLHQTTCVINEDQLNTRRYLYYPDLPGVLDDPERMGGEWRVHFHVPIFIDSFGLLQTSRSEIQRCLSAVSTLPYLPQLEVETYAWGVLPPELQREDLSQGISAEIAWIDQLVADQGW